MRKTGGGGGGGGGVYTVRNEKCVCVGAGVVTRAVHTVQMKSVSVT